MSENSARDYLYHIQLVNTRYLTRQERDDYYEKCKAPPTYTRAYNARGIGGGGTLAGSVCCFSTDYGNDLEYAIEHGKWDSNYPNAAVRDGITVIIFEAITARGEQYRAIVGTVVGKTAKLTTVDTQWPSYYARGETPKKESNQKKKVVERIPTPRAVMASIVPRGRKYYEHY